MTILTLGGYVFEDFEIPSSINLGGEQMLTVHQLPGGTRVIDAMGASHADIRWSGRFRGATAEENARYLDTQRKQGNALLLTYSLQRYQVVIRSFEANFQQSYEIPYSITCTVLEDESDQILTGDPTLDALIASDLASATTIAGTLGLTKVTTAIGGVTNAFNLYEAAVPTVTNGLGAVQSSLLSGVQTNIVTAQSSVTDSITSTAAQVSSTPVIPGAAPQSIAAALSTTANASVQLSSLYQLSGFLSRMNKNASQ